MAEPLPFDPIEEAGRQWKKHWGMEAVPAMIGVTSLMRVHQILMARLNRELKEFGLTFPRYEALMLLFFSRRGSLPLGKMGDRLQLHRTSITNTVDGLERLGYVSRSPHETDRRAVLASITPSGRDVAQSATLKLNRFGFGTHPLGDDELEALAATLERIRVDAGDFADTPETRASS